MSKPSATPSRPRAAPSPRARTSRRAWSRSRTSRSAAGAALNVTPEDHEGGGWVQIWTVKGGKFEKATDWFQAYRDVVKKHLRPPTERLRSPSPSPRALRKRMPGQGGKHSWVAALRAAPSGRMTSCSRSTISRSSTTTSSWCSGACRSRSSRARSPRCWAPTAPASRRRSRPYPASSSPSAATSPRGPSRSRASPSTASVRST